MNPFQKETAEIAVILDEAAQKIAAIDNPEIAALKTKILMDLKRHSNSMKQNIGVDISQGTHVVAPAPLRKMFGRVLGEAKQTPTNVSPEAPFSESSFEVAEKELAARVEYLYPKFTSTPADQIIDSFTDIEIRGIAKKAGLPVTEDEPKKITAKFIDQVIAAINANPPAVNEPASDPLLDENKEPPLPENFDQLSDEDKELAVVRKDVDTLYKAMDTLSNKTILEDYSNIEIRGIAKKAGLPVTEDEPAKLDSKFITQIKEAKATQLKIANAGK